MGGLASYHAGLRRPGSGHRARGVRPAARGGPRCQRTSPRRVRRGVQPDTDCRLGSATDRRSAGGRPVARDILERAIAELTASVAAVVEKLCLYPDTYPLVLAGGLFEHGLFHRLLTEQVGHELPHLKPVKPEHPPAYGAALLALAAGGRAGKETQR